MPPRGKAVPAAQKYQAELINWDDPNCSHVRMLNLIGEKKRVLEFGCYTGYMSAKLKERGFLAACTDLSGTGQ